MPDTNIQVHVVLLRKWFLAGCEGGGGVGRAIRLLQGRERSRIGKVKELSKNVISREV